KGWGARKATRKQIPRRYAPRDDSVERGTPHCFTAILHARCSSLMHTQGHQNHPRARSSAMLSKRSVLAWMVVALPACALHPGPPGAHNVSKRDASFVESNRGAAIGPFLYLGAKHMVTGYDHILFLVG